MLHIVNEVLDYSRLESGKIEFEKKEFYPLEIAEEVASAVRVQAEKKGLDLVFDTTMASNELVEGDEFRLGRSSITCWATQSSSLRKDK
ncbi:MAG: hypothetical protein WDO15_25960 [Bacteroidota bacterium]